MPFVAILAVDAENRVAKYEDFPSLAAAQAHVDALQADYPGAFAAPAPAAHFFAWRVNMAAKAISIDPRPVKTDREAPAVRALRVVAQALDPAKRAEILAILDGDG